MKTERRVSWPALSLLALWVLVLAALVVAKIFDRSTRDGEQGNVATYQLSVLVYDPFHKLAKGDTVTLLTGPDQGSSPETSSSNTSAAVSQTNNSQSATGSSTGVATMLVAATKQASTSTTTQATRNSVNSATSATTLLTSKSQAATSSKCSTSSTTASGTVTLASATASGTSSQASATNDVFPGVTVEELGPYPVDSATPVRVLIAIPVGEQSDSAKLYHFASASGVYFLVTGAASC